MLIVNTFDPLCANKIDPPKNKNNKTINRRGENFAWLASLGLDRYRLQPVEIKAGEATATGKNQ